MATSCQPPQQIKIVVAVSLAWLPVVCEEYNNLRGVWNKALSDF